MKAFDKTAKLQDLCLVNGQQYKLGAVGLSTGRRFVLLKGTQKAEYFTSGSKKIPVFYYRAAMLDTSNNIVCIDQIGLTNLCRNTYGPVKYNDQGERIPAPKIGFTVSAKGNAIPESFGDEVNCGWDVRKEFVKKDGDNSLYNGVIDYEQAFEVDRCEFHWISDFDSITWQTKQDIDGNVAMRIKLIPIIKRIDMPEGVLDAISKL